MRAARVSAPFCLRPLSKHDIRRSDIPNGERDEHRRHDLRAGETDMVSGLLPAPSWIRTNRIVTLNVSLVVKTVGRKFGRLKAGSISESRRCLRWVTRLRR